MLGSYTAHRPGPALSVGTKSAKNRTAFLRRFVIVEKALFGERISPGRLRLWPIGQIVASIAFRIGQHRQKPRAGFPGDLSMFY